jgi:hypothetical protein
MAAEEPVRLLVVLGSVTPPGRLRRALEEAIARAQHAHRQDDPEIEIELIDLAEQRLSFAATALDELIAGAASLAARTREDTLLGPSPLAARMIRR